VDALFGLDLGILDKNGKRQAGRQFFRNSKIPQRMLSKYRASLSRTLRRLEEWGFLLRVRSATGNWAGVNLTESGIDVALAFEGNENS
jgi:hypothetical protein